MVSWLFTSQVVCRNRRLPVIRFHISEILSTSLSKALLLEDSELFLNYFEPGKKTHLEEKCRKK